MELVLLLWEAVLCMVGSTQTRIGVIVVTDKATIEVQMNVMTVLDVHQTNALGPKPIIC